MTRTLQWCLVLASLALVVWIRTLPLELHGTDAVAGRMVRAELSARITREAAAERLSAREIETRVNQWVERQPVKFEQQRQALSTRLQQDLRYQGPDQRSYVYLGDFDSYSWLRMARNYLKSGTTCDALVNGECRNMYDDAPLGRRWSARSLHVAAIVAVHSIIRLLEPDYPLAASSFWVPVVAGALGVLPAFFIGRRLAGLLGGFSAALLIAVHPVFLERSIGSDNDVWNVVLPLFMVWAVMEALSVASARRQVALAVTAAAFAALHAATWSGWAFTYAVVVAALLGNLLLQVVGNAINVAPQGRSKKSRVRLRDAPGVRTAARVALVFYVMTGVLTWLAAPERAYLSIPLTLVRAAGAPVEEGRSVPGERDVWPDVLTTVTELQHTDLGSILANDYGPVFCGTALFGALLLLLPRRRWRRPHVVLCIASGALFAFVVTHPDLSATATMVLVALPLAAAAALRMWEDPLAAASDSGPALIAVTWLVAGLYVAFSGDRFLLLLAPGLGIAIAVTFGRAYEAAAQGVRRLAPRHGGSAAVFLFVACATLLILPVRDGYAAARDYLPRINDGWWDALSSIRDRSAPDAIVNTWWDYGYWVQYIAERRTTADGGLLRTHLPYWLGRVLVSADERESVGLLRMLNCGSDATPLDEGRQGAYAKVLNKVGEVSTAQSIVVDLARLNRSAAAAYLAQHGFSAAEQDDVLASTHCTPPETYLTVSSELLARDTWMRLGLWNLRKAYIAQAAAQVPQSEAITDFTRRFGYTESEAAKLYTEARTTPRDDFVIGRAPRAPSNFFPCRPGPEPMTIRCPIGLLDTASHRIVEEFIFDIVTPQRSRLRYRSAEPGRSIGQPIDVAPGALVVAEQHLTDVDLPSPRYDETAVLLDQRDWRILIGPPALIRSTFTHLFYLDGRYATHFAKFDERTSYLNDRVITYKVRYEDP